MTNILVPTDFTPSSLRLAETALKTARYEKCNLILFHAFELPSSPFDAWFKNERDPSGDLLTENFRHACKQLKDDYAEKVGKIVVRCMLGNTRAVFRNFAEANDVDLIFCPEEYYFTPAHARSVDPTHLFRKCGVPVVKNEVNRVHAVFNPAFLTAVRTAAR